MDPIKIAELINDQVLKQVKGLANRTFYRGIVDAIKGRTVDVLVEGNTTPIPGIVCLNTYNPVVGDKVLMVSIGLTGTNFLVIDKIDETGLVINLITNPSMETNDDGWSISQGVGGAAADGSAPFGDDSFWLQNVGGGDATYASGNLISGKQYTFSLYIKHTGNSSQLDVFHDGNNKYSTTSFTTGWVRHNVTFTATANSPLTVSVNKAGADQSLYIDGMMLTEGDTLYDYFDGSEPPSGGTSAWDGTAHASTSRAYIPNTDNTWIVPSMQNSWIRFDTTWSEQGYMRDHMGFIHLRGLIKSGTVGSTAFTLPAGYRPTSQLLIGTISNGAIGRVRVNTNGTVVPESPSSNVWVALDGITFKADDSGL